MKLGEFRPVRRACRIQGWQQINQKLERVNLNSISETLLEITKCAECKLNQIYNNHNSTIL